eukprot:COSAG05_NODE_323_length_11408_cov_361.826156_18_plen_236_part_01
MQRTLMVTSNFHIHACCFAHSPARPTTCIVGGQAGGRSLEACGAALAGGVGRLFAKFGCRSCLVPPALDAQPGRGTIAYGGPWQLHVFICFIVLAMTMAVWACPSPLPLSILDALSIYMGHASQIYSHVRACNPQVRVGVLGYGPAGRSVYAQLLHLVVWLSIALATAKASFFLVFWSILCSVLFCFVLFRFILNFIENIVVSVASCFFLPYAGDARARAVFCQPAQAMPRVVGRP